MVLMIIHVHAVGRAATWAPSTELSLSKSDSAVCPTASTDSTSSPPHHSYAASYDLPVAPSARSVSSCSRGSTHLPCSANETAPHTAGTSTQSGLAATAHALV